MHSVKAYVMTHHTVTFPKLITKIWHYNKNGQFNTLKVLIIVQDGVHSSSRK